MSSGEFSRAQQVTSPRKSPQLPGQAGDGEQGGYRPPLSNRMCGRFLAICGGDSMWSCIVPRWGRHLKERGADSAQHHSPTSTLMVPRRGARPVNNFSCVCPGKRVRVTLQGLCNENQLLRRSQRSPVFQSGCFGNYVRKTIQSFRDTPVTTGRREPL